MRRLLFTLILALALFSCAREESGERWTTVMEATSFRISALLGGRISKIYVTEGEEIESGAKIAELDAQELQFSLEQQMAALQELAVQEELFLTQIEIASADLEYQSRRQGRSERLYEEEVIPLQNLEDGQLLKSKAELQYQAAQKNLRLAEARKASILAQIKTLKKRIEDSTIISEFSGRIEHLYFDEGEMLPNMGQLAEVLDTKSLEANIYVNEEYLALFKPGMRLMLAVSGHADRLEARVIKISNKAEFTPKTVLTPDNRSVMVYAIRLRAENPQGILKDGMPVDVYLP